MASRARRTLAASCASFFDISPSLSERRLWTKSSMSEATLRLQGSRRDGRPGARSRAGQGARARRANNHENIPIGQPSVGGWLPTSSVAVNAWLPQASYPCGNFCRGRPAWRRGVRVRCHLARSRQPFDPRVVPRLLVQVSTASNKAMLSLGAKVGLPPSLPLSLPPLSSPPSLPPSLTPSLNPSLPPSLPS